MNIPLRVLLVASGLISLAACAPSATLTAARQADFPALRARISRTPVTSGSVLREIAQNALSAELKRAQGHDGRELIRTLGPCSSSLGPALAERARTRDAVGGEAALLAFRLVDYRTAHPKSFRSSEEGAWRALAARASGGDHASRVAYFLDDDERVRAAALEAAAEAKDARDLPALLEVSRVDPAPGVRSQALLTLGQIGGQRSLTALIDRYQTAETPLRLTIIDALGSPAQKTSGGLRQLERIVHRDVGLAPLHAAFLLSRQKGELGQKGVLRLVEFQQEGTEEERRLALRRLPAEHPATEGLLARATTDPNPEVAIIAWARLLGRPLWAASAERALVRLSRDAGQVADEASAALASGGSDAILPRLKMQTRSEYPAVRRVAGFGLLRLGAYRDLAPLLADADPEVRRPLSCRVLAAAERSQP